MNMGKELQSIESADKFQMMAKKIAMSGMFGVKNENQVYALMLIAESESLHPMKAVQQYHIINGKPALKSTEVLSRFQQSGGKIKWIKSDDNTAEAELSHPDGGSITIEWTIAKAQKAGIYETNPTWKKYPSNMLRARVITDGVNALYPACLGGAMTQSQAEDIPIIEEEEEVEAEVIDIDVNQLKRDLSSKLRKLSMVDADIKDFADQYDLSNDTELLSKLVENEEELLNYVKEFEDGN